MLHRPGISMHLPETGSNRLVYHGYFSQPEDTPSLVVQGCSLKYLMVLFLVHQEKLFVRDEI